MKFILFLFLLITVFSFSAHADQKSPTTHKNEPVKKIKSNQENDDAFERNRKAAEAQNRMAQQASQRTEKEWAQNSKEKKQWAGSLIDNNNPPWAGSLN